jgi:hypothetical protein
MGYFLLVYFLQHVAAVVTCTLAGFLLSAFGVDGGLYICLSAVPFGFLLPRSKSGILAAQWVWILPTIFFSAFF